MVTRIGCYHKNCFSCIECTRKLDSMTCCEGKFGQIDSKQTKSKIEKHKHRQPGKLDSMTCCVDRTDRQKTETTGTVVTLQPVIGRKVTEVNKIHVNPMSYYYVLIHFVYLLPWSHTLLLYNRPNRLDS